MFSVIRPAPLAFDHVPFLPSPLTARDVNTCPDFSRSMASLVKLSGSEKDVTSGKRMYKHPILQRREGELSRRRQAFLKKVKESSDDERWQTRSDQIQRQYFLSQQQQWREELARTAPVGPAAMEEEEEKSQARPGTDSEKEVEVVDEVLTQEDRELEALVSLMSDEQKSRDGQQHDASEYGSDEEDYDGLFLEALANAEGNWETLTVPKVVQEPDLDYEMDVSVG